MVWPDPALGPLCSVDRRFPLPGNVGVLHEGQAEEDAYSYVDPVITLPFQPEERHFSVLAHYFSQDSQVSARLPVYATWSILNTEKILKKFLRKKEIKSVENGPLPEEEKSQVGKSNRIR